MEINESILSLENCFKKLITVIFLIGSFKTNAQMDDSLNPTTIKIDYGNLNYWAAHPQKKDPSDSNTVVHKVLDSNIKAHVFFIHPTTYTGKLINDNWNADVDDVELNMKTDMSTILYQSTAFKNSTVIFAPRYRQAHIKAFYVDDKISEPYFDMAYNDVKNAFEYYLAHYNHNYPFIIAAHSQGTKHAGRLIKEIIEKTELKDRLVCAYIIGMPIPEEYFSVLKPCYNENESGCYVGWRTYKNGYIPNEILNEKFRSVVINPLSWTSNPGKIDKEKNEGGVLSNYKKLVPKVVDAEIHGNILWSCKPDVFGKFFFTKKNFHIGDINLFYKSINENVGTRISSFLKKKEN